MALEDHVQLSITTETLRLTQEGFGVPMIVSHSANGVFNPGERVRFFDSISTVSDDFPSGTVEFLAANALFTLHPGGSPVPNRIAIGSIVATVTQVYEIVVEQVVPNRLYMVQVRDAGVVNELASFDSGGSPDNDSIVLGIVGVLNGVAGKNYTAAAIGAPTATTVEVTGDAANNWFSLEILDTNDLSISQTHADPGMVAELTALALNNDEWYTLHTLFNAKDYILAVVQYVETVKKFYLFDTNDTEVVQTASPGTDAVGTIQTAARSRSGGSYHSSPYDMYVASWYGRQLPQDPGGTNWKFKRLSGPRPVNLTPIQRSNLRSKNGNSYERVAGVNITFEGTMGEGEFMDIIRGIDWLDAEMTTRVFGVLVQNEKLGFNDPDMAVIEEAIRASLGLGITRGLLTSIIFVQVPLAVDTDPVDRAVRTFKTIRWQAGLQGSINKVIIEGVVTV